MLIFSRYLLFNFSCYNGIGAVLVVVIAIAFNEQNGEQPQVENDPLTPPKIIAKPNPSYLLYYEL